MPDFDDDEYESFDPHAPESAPESVAVASRTATVEAEAEDADDEADDVDDLGDDLEDAAEDEIDFVLAAYREDGQLYVQALAKDLANDLEELVGQLRRLPADAGALGFVSLVEEVFVIVRVRGRHVQVLLNDGTAAGDWPIARDVADLLGEEIPDPDDEPEPMGDPGLLSDVGLRAFEMEAIAGNLDLSSDQMLLQVADKVGLNPQFRRAVEAAFGS